MTLDHGAGLRQHSFIVLGVNVGPGQTQTSCHLSVAMFGRQVEGLHSLAIGKVNIASKSTQCLGQSQLTIPGTDVDRSLPLAIDNVKVSSGVEQEKSDVTMIAAQCQVQGRRASPVLGVNH